METFVGKCIKDMMKSNVSIHINKRKNNSKNAASFFDGMRNDIGKSVFCVNYYDNDLSDNFGIFVHEFSHFLQWKAQTELWKNGEKASILFDRWINQKAHSFSKKHLKDIQLLELDCDRRALKLIKKYDLPIDVDDYIKQSNSYVLSYNYLYEQRKFFNFSAYAHKDILKLVPDKHISDDDISMELSGYRELFLEKSK